MRLFLGIFPPKETLDQLRDIRRKYFIEKQNLKFNAVDQLHITLKFIGSDVSLESMEVIRNAVKNYENHYGEVEVNFDKVQFGFKRDSFPKYLLAKVKKSPELVNLSNLLHETVKQEKLLDTVRFKQRFTNEYHITLGRIKKTANRSTAIRIKSFTLKSNFPVLKPFLATEMWLVESILEKGKPPQYRKLERIKL